MESFNVGLTGATLSLALTASSQSLTLSRVPTDLTAGRYTFRIDGELLSASYDGSGRLFGNLARGLEGTTASTHALGATVLHQVRGEPLNQFARSTRPDIGNYIRTPAARAFIASNFT